MNPSPTRCALYTRVSSRSQVDKDYNSLETQRERLEAYCRSQDNFEIHRVYEDGAYSAETLNRPALQQMLQDIRAGKVNCVLAYKIDRLTRSVKDFHLLMDFFDKFGVKFVSITQSLDTQHPMGRLLRNILLDFAQFEREMTADRIRDKMHQRAQKGLWNGGAVPYGYRNENRRLVRHEEEAARIQFLFETFANRPSLAHLRAELSRRGWLTRAGLPWTKSVLSYVLSNPIYVGRLPYASTTFAAQHEQLVPEALFNKVQTLTRQRERVRSSLRRPFLLKGLLLCSDCGSTMTPHYVQKRRKDGSIHRVPYYRCTRTMKYDNRACRIKHLNADQAEAFVVRSVCDLSQNEAALEATLDELNRNDRAKVEPLEKEARHIKARLDELDAEVDRFVQALAKGTIAVDRLEQEMRRREADKAVLASQYAELQRKVNEVSASDYNAEVVKRNLREFRRVFDQLTPTEQTEALQCILKQIAVAPDKLTLEVFELSDFAQGSQKRSEWCPGQDSNLGPID